MQNRMMITGAGSGLGREIALRWARDGWRLALADVNEAGLAESLKLVREAGGDGFTQRCDVRDYSQLTALAQSCEEKFGGIDVIVNNAGWPRRLLRRVVPGGLGLADRDQPDGRGQGLQGLPAVAGAKQGQDRQHRLDGGVDAGPGDEQLQRGQGRVVALSESLLVELALVEVGVHVVCPSFFQTNLLDSSAARAPR